MGAIFTKEWVAGLVLDLGGYVSTEPLWDRTVIEPACGHGAFLGLIIDRLIASCQRDGVSLWETRHALVATDLDLSAVVVSRQSARARLVAAGMNERAATDLATHWIRHADFLKEAGSLPEADWVVGNPPYVRIEDVSRRDMTDYRSKWATMSGRADLYVGFYEAGLGRLKPGGTLSYICADRWMRNQYGAALRAFVENGFAIDACVVMHAVDAFEDRVAAYPAVTVISRNDQADALVVEASDTFDAASADRLVKLHARGASPVVVDGTFRASWLDKWPHGAASWPSGAPERLSLLGKLEARLPTLAETGAFVSVGTATGADDVYVVDDPTIVEPQFIHPTLAARETTHGGIDWRNRYLVTPWTRDGLADLGDAPRLAAYLESNRARLERRHIAKRSSDRWWRTIDRIDPAVAGRPKLLIPDLKDRIHPVYDQGKFIPLHSLYYITSEEWDLAVLGGLLLSDVANMFVESYSVRMANGYMRVSAQYLRRVRVPDPSSLTRRQAEDLRAAFWARDRIGANAAACDAYGIGPSV